MEASQAIEVELTFSPQKEIVSKAACKEQSGSLL